MEEWKLVEGEEQEEFMRGEKKCGGIELGAYHSNFQILYWEPHC